MDIMQKRDDTFGLSLVDRIEEGLPTDSYDAALAAAGLDGEPSLRAVHVHTLTGESVTLPERANVLVYPDGREAYAGIVGSKYHPVSDRDGLAPLRPAFEAGRVQDARAIVLDSGARVMMQLKLKTEDVVPGKPSSAVQGWLGGSHSHDGQWKFAFGESNIVAVCRNTAAMVRAMADSRFKHTKQARVRLDVLTNAMARFEGDWAKSMELYRHLAERQINPERLFTLLYPDPVKDETGAATTKMRRNRELLSEILDTMPGSDVAKGSAWNAFNAVTYRIDNGGDRPATERAKYSLFGLGSQIREKALEIVIKLANGEDQIVTAGEASGFGIPDDQIGRALGPVYDIPIADE